MESRKPALSRPSLLPADYLKLVRELYSTNFDTGLKALSKAVGGDCELKVTGAVFNTEVLLGVSILAADRIAATTVQASCDFDPKASSPTLEDLLGAAVDAAGAVLDSLLDAKDPARIAQVAQDSLAAMEDVPTQWTEVKSGKHRVFVRVDKSNPVLDQAADDWLKKNDPKHKELEEQEESETEKLFVTGPTRPLKPSKPGSGTVH